MDRESRVVFEFIGRVGAARARLTEFAATVRSDRRVVRAPSALECVKYLFNDPMIEGYVEAQLAGGHAVSWLLDVSWADDHWLITSEVAANRSEYQETLKRFPDRVATTFADLLNQIDGAVLDLVGSIEYLDIADKPTGGE